MKTIGRTEEGNVLVEMTADEYGEFIYLENVVVGGGFYFDAPRKNFRGVDLSPVFKALNELATAKHSITTLQGYINNLANYFGKVELPESKKEINA